MNTESLIIHSLDEPSEAFIERLIASGGPVAEDYPALEMLFNAADLDSVQHLRFLLAPVCGLASVHGFAWSQPFGYAGDFSIIEKIYAKSESADPSHRKWDRFFQSLHSCRAVRNRRKFLVDWLELNLPPTADGEVLSVASGPCREIIDYFERHPDDTVRFTCIDQDANAVAFASALLYPWRERVSFLQQSAFKSVVSGPFDLIYSAGLFDYLSDRLSVGLIRRLWKKLKTGGKMLVGNFSPENPSRGYMEFGGWKLIHRTENELMELMRRGTGGCGDITCASEPLGINLFAEAVKP